MQQSVTFAPEAAVAQRLLVTGYVQGIGFRSRIARLAAEVGVAGWVRNHPAGVLVHLEGSAAAIGQFRSGFGTIAAPPARIAGLMAEPSVPEGIASFSIGPSAGGEPVGVVPPRDLALCDACRREIFDPADRRHRHPFTHCTDCGPRYSVLLSLPYDRSATTMGAFTPCPSCRDEFHALADRRFHAELIACPACGPDLHFLPARSEGDDPADPILAAATVLKRGKIVALKGLGGYQLLCRADIDAPVRRLRRLKLRPSKPFAVMFRSFDQVGQWFELNRLEREFLVSSENPIVVLRPLGRVPLSESVAPGLGSMGVLLPTTPLHHLLLRELAFPVVATSANREDEPMITDDREMAGRLGAMCDAVLAHNRGIARRIDDSVISISGERAVVLRGGRGFLPASLPSLERLAREAKAPPLVALGGHQKVALAVWTGRQAVLAPHVGDMDSPAHRAAFSLEIRRWSELLDFRPARLACDLHPEYFTTRWAMEQGLPVTTIQHHHAHAASAIVAHDLVDREVLALAWDGTGYGTDGMIWGGEILRASVGQYQRVASLLPFAMPGGEEAIREPGRLSLAVLAAALGHRRVLAAPQLLARLGFDRPAAARVLHLVGRKLYCPMTTSMGRLFDALAALILATGTAGYEGELAQRLEEIAFADSRQPYPFFTTVSTDKWGANTLLLDWRPMVVQVVADLARGVPARMIAARYHATLAAWVAAVLAPMPLPDVVLTGGCFQNRLLTQDVVRSCSAIGKRVYCGGSVPPGDGGLAVGQLAVAVARCRREV